MFLIYCNEHEANDKKVRIRKQVYEMAMSLSKFDWPLTIIAETNEPYKYVLMN